MQGSLPAGWLAFTGRESNPLDHDERFQITFSSPLPGLILTQRSPLSIIPIGIFVTPLSAKARGMTARTLTGFDSRHRMNLPNVGGTMIGCLGERPAFARAQEGRF